MKRTLRNLGVLVISVCALFGGCRLVLYSIGFHPFPVPPRVGERADSVILRLGPPAFDSRQQGDQEDDYRLGYTDGIGTRHHLHVVRGSVVEIEYSSR
jgi:hypothetical protein